MSTLGQAAQLAHEREAAPCNTEVVFLKEPNSTVCILLPQQLGLVSLKLPWLPSAQGQEDRG